MTRALIAAFAGLSFAVSVGCATLSSTSATVTEHKALLAAAAAVDGAAVALDAAFKSGALKGDAAAQATADLKTAHQYLLDAKAAEAALDETTLAAKIVAITSLVGTIMTEAGK